MSAYTPSRGEQETTISWDEEIKTARIYTASPVSMRKLDKLTKECPEAYKHIWTDPSGYPAKKYEVDARYIRFGKPASEAFKEQARQRAIESGMKPPFKKNDSSGESKG